MEELRTLRGRSPEALEPVDNAQRAAATAIDGKRFLRGPMATEQQIRERKVERERLRKKRSDPAYRLKENEANRKRMRARRGKQDTAYVAMERSNGWWK
jgi:hypothetical protein